MTTFSAALFDLDDTLIDFKKSEQISLKKCYHRYFHHLISWEAFQKHYDRINRALWDSAEKGEISISIIGQKRFQNLAELYRIPFLPEIGLFYEEQLILHSDWTPGAEELLIEMNNRSIPIGFITNGFTHLQQHKHKKLALHRFSNILVISEKLGVAKPHPDIFLHALALIKSPLEQTLMIGDSLTSDGQGAKNLAIPFCWYNPKKLPTPPEFQPHLVVAALHEIIPHFPARERP